MRDRIAAGFDPPARRRLAELKADPTLAEDFAGEFLAALIPLASERLVSLDAGLLIQIDEAAKLRGLTRSGFLAAAARDKIAADR